MGERETVGITGAREKETPHLHSRAYVTGMLDFHPNLRD